MFSQDYHVRYLRFTRAAKALTMLSEKIEQVLTRSTAGQTCLSLSMSHTENCLSGCHSSTFQSYGTGRKIGRQEEP